MSLTSVFAIYFLIWWMVLFTVLPFGVRTQEEAGEVVPGSPESAPEAPRMVRVLLRTTIIAALIFVPIYLALSAGVMELLAPES